MIFERKKASKAYYKTELLDKRLNETEYHYRKAKAKSKLAVGK